MSPPSSLLTNAKLGRLPTETPKAVVNVQCTERRPRSKIRQTMHKIADWFVTSEPSVQALMSHQKAAFQKAGVISTRDPTASSKLHAPVGKIPEHAIKPMGRGPDPEDLVQKAAQNRRLHSSAGESRSGRSHSSSISSSRTTTMKSTTYRDEFPFT